MTSNLYRHESFIVRIWWERGPGPRALWRGQVVHARTGQSIYFDSLPAMLHFMQGWTGSLAPGSDQGRTEEVTMGQEV